MSSTSLAYLTVDSVGALDPTGKFQRVYVDPSSGIAIVGTLPIPTPATPVNDSQSSAAAFTATLTAVIGKTTSLLGFDLTVPAILAVTAALVTITGLAGFPANTLSFALSLLTTGSQFIYRPPAPLPALAPNTAIIVHVPATIAGTWLNVYGQQT